MGYKQIFISQNQIETQLVKSLLASSNIYSFIENEQQTKEGVFYGSSLVGARLFVREEDFGKATEVLTEYIDKDINKASEGRLQPPAIYSEKSSNEHNKIPSFIKIFIKWLIFLIPVWFIIGFLVFLIRNGLFR